MADSGRGRSRKGDCATTGPSFIDHHVGRRIKMRRLLLEIELHHLAGDLGILASTLAHVEAGEERPTPALLARIGSVLGVSVGWFFRGLDRDAVPTFSEPAQGEAIAQMLPFAQPDVGSEMFELLDVFLQVDAVDRRAILDDARQRVRKQRR
jgi:transcriptional regulator with XRE-family HTH domain